MCRHIHDLPLTVGIHPRARRDIHAAIESIMGSLTDYLTETYTPLILDRLGYEPSPSNAHLFVPIGDAEQHRREEAERRQLRKWTSSQRRFQQRMVVRLSDVSAG